MVLFGTAEYK